MRTGTRSDRWRRGLKALFAVAALSAVAACGSAGEPAGRSTTTSPAGPTPEAGWSAAAASPDLDDAGLQRVLDDARAELGFPGVKARVITANDTWDGAAGTTAAGGSTVPSASDHTRIGSLTKTMTATILLQLVGEEKLSLNDTVSKYLPGIPNGGATLRQVADMTSGIPSYTLDQQVTDRYLTSPQLPWTSDQLLDAVRTLTPKWAPGKGWEYSNSNYVILGEIIEKITGKPLAQVFSERLFTPLGMSQTSYPSGTALPKPYLSGITMQGATGDTPRDATGFNPSFAAAAGQVVSTMDDLQRWAHALFTGDGVLDPQLQQLRRDSILTSPPPNTATAGYGIGIGDRDGWWGHDGDIPGYTTSVFHNYDTDTTVIVIVNSDIQASASGKAPAPYVFGGLIQALSQKGS